MASLRDYIRAAFSAKPIGMFVPPNWLGLAAFGVLGLINPGFWLLGMGLELGYLYWLGFNPRFRRFVDATSMGANRQAWRAKLSALVTQLGPDDQRLYRGLENRCSSILSGQQTEAASAGLQAQSQGLSRLLWIYLRLLLTRDSIRRVLLEQNRSTDQRPLDERVKEVKNRLDKPGLSEELRKSLTSQMEILQQRKDGLEQAQQKLAFLDAEITRIQEQVELIREQAALATDPMVVSQRIDAVAATLGDTTQWIREQQRMYGQVEDLLTEPPPMAVESTPLPEPPPIPIPPIPTPPPRQARKESQ